VALASVVLEHQSIHAGHTGISLTVLANADFGHLTQMVYSTNTALRCNGFFDFRLVAVRNVLLGYCNS
jgi:hypothetical protein